MLSARDRELQNARIQIEKAPIIRNAPDVYASLFRNYSKFIRLVNFSSVLNSL